MRMNCNLIRAIRFGYFWPMVRYCNAWGWKHCLKDTFNLKRLK